MDTNQITELAGKLSEDNSRKDLNKQGKSLGLVPKNYKDKDQIAYAIASILAKKMVNGKELPQYKSSKVVGGLKIAKATRLNDGTVSLEFENEDYGTLIESAHFNRTKNPKSEGYYVIYDNGDRSYQSAELFEAGYDEVE